MPVRRILSFVACLPVACVKSLMCLNSTLVLVWKCLTTSNSFWERLHSVWTTRGERPSSMLGKKTSTPKEDCLQMVNCFSHWSNCGTTFPSSFRCEPVDGIKDIFHVGSVFVSFLRGNKHLTIEVTGEWAHTPRLCEEVSQHPCCHRRNGV